MLQEELDKVIVGYIETLKPNPANEKKFQEFLQLIPNIKPEHKLTLIKGWLEENIN
jgi:hypothetical protein